MGVCPQQGWRHRWFLQAGALALPARSNQRGARSLLSSDVAPPRTRRDGPTAGDRGAEPGFARGLALREAVPAHLRELDAILGDATTGTVLRATSGYYDVAPDDHVVAPALAYRCRVRDRMRKDLVFSESGAHAKRVDTVRRRNVVEPIVAGDRVRFRASPVSGDVVPEGIIDEILPRTRALTRQAVTDGKVPVGQTLVANLDQIIVVTSAGEPGPRWGFVDRVLASCAATGFDARICLNKVDFGIDEDMIAEATWFVRAGYPVHLTSAVTGEGIEELRSATAGRLSAFAGTSGVGKSSLLNAIEPGLSARVGAISRATGKGTHTTRFAQVFPLAGGGFLADTPGLRQLALWDVSDTDLDRLFPEFAQYLGTCRFGNCAHVTDDGCAVRTAAESNEINPRRYLSYVKLFTDG